jgi:hypothetical protein
MKRLRALVPAFLLAMALIVASSACGGKASDNKSNGGNEGEAVDWSSFTTMERTGLRSSNLGELNSKAGFGFVLPSYLPPGTSHTFILSSQIDSVSPGSGDVTILSNDKLAPEIRIDEHLRHTGEPIATSYGDEYDVRTISDVLVGCLPESQTAQEALSPDSVPYIGLSCQWGTEELSFDVRIVWRVDQEAPRGVSSEQRDEVMKVVTSMIENPYIP